MINLTTQTPQQSLSSEIIRLRPTEVDFVSFKTNLNTLLEKIDDAQTEENQKNNIRDFLLRAFYEGKNEVNVKKKQDLVIHIGAVSESNVGVIVETKRATNKAEMITKGKPNVKAFHELVLYFMRERVDAKNDDIKYLIATNINDWFIFKASDFNRIFYSDKVFLKSYEDWRDKNKVSGNTEHFYNHIAKPFVEGLDETLLCTYFNLKDYETANEADLIALYKIFSPFHLLKKPFENDSNALDKNFYTELLHIIGLEETKEKNKTLIKRKAKPDSGSLLEKAIAKIDSKFSRFDQKKMFEFGATREERIYNIALELCIVWTNRVLFLKLLESQLVAYHENDAEYRFLNTKTINSFGELYVLFHDVLNKTIANREANISAKYAHVPYLNSSLFDFADVENLTTTVDELDNNINLALPNSSILRKIGETDKDLPTLEYLFRFLDAYDFASEGKEDVQQENRSLINASVLGKVFEKINGYKDGSIYTPGFITMYMCRQAIRLAVVQKFKDETDFDSDSFDDLQSYVGRFYKADDIKRFNQHINDLKLCDPAVGSGHFLVSALNEILAIKSELGIFADTNGKPFSQYAVKVANDEIVVTDRDNRPFRYTMRNGKPATDEMQNLQRALFHEKQLLIENCLFGVDINPNSVKICRLRLWIELLKNAYYKPADDYTELETLPNIDINIKQGNSLLSRFALDADLKQALKTKDGIKDYRDKVYQYKNERNRDIKRQLLDIIEKIKTDFSTEIFKSHPLMRELLKYQKRFDEFNSEHLFEKYTVAEREVGKRIEQEKINRVNVEIEAIKTNAIYKNAFEWRFEFPEVIDNDGNFLGFDIVIGNPPYIRQEEIGELKDYLKKDYRVFTGTADILVYFYERGLHVLKQNGKFSFITSNKFMRANYGKPLRNFLGNFTLDEIIDFGDAPVFGGIAAYASIVNLQKTATEQAHQTRVYTFPTDEYVPDFEASYRIDGFNVAQKDLTPNGWRLERLDVLDLLAKLRSKGTPLGEYVNGRFYRGIITGLNEAFVVDRVTRDRLIAEDASSAETLEPYLRGRDVKRWLVNYDDLFLIKIESSSNKKHAWTNKRNIEAEEIFSETYPAIYKHLNNHRQKLIKRDDQGMYFWELRACIYWHEFEQPKIILPAIEKRTAFALDEEGYFGNDKTNICVSPDAHFLVAILNSSVTWWIIQQTASGKQGGYYEFKPMYVSQIPIPKISPEAQAPFIKLVDEILRLKKAGEATIELENKIDAMVYDLYDLDQAERRIVSGQD